MVLHFLVIDVDNLWQLSDQAFYSEANLVVHFEVLLNKCWVDVLPSTGSASYSIRDIMVEQVRKAVVI